MKYCKTCSKEDGELLYKLDVVIMEAIKREFPEWVEEDGICTKCLDYYGSLNEINLTKKNIP